MDKYKFKSTVYLVFLLVSLFISGMLLYMLISNEYRNKEKVKEEPKIENVSIDTIQDVYSKTYDYINGGNVFIDTGYKVNNEVCPLVNFNGMEDYFTNKAINSMKKHLKYVENNYYDCGYILESTLFNSMLGERKREIEIILSSDTRALVSSKFKYGCEEIDDYPLYMVISKENNLWLIDSFE